MRRTIVDFRGPLGELATEVRGLVRRVAIKAVSSSRFWQLLGYSGIEGEFEVFAEVEAFQGIGFASRPPAGQGEAVVVHAGGRAGHAVAIASRDLSTAPDDLSEDETQVHNAVVQVRLTPSGEVRVNRRLKGKPVALATLADLQELRAWVAAQFNAAAGHTHATPTGPTTTTTPAVAQPSTPPAPKGTSVLKAE